MSTCCYARSASFSHFCSCSVLISVSACLQQKSCERKSHPTLAAVSREQNIYPPWPCLSTVSWTCCSGAAFLKGCERLGHFNKHGYFWLEWPGWCIMQIHWKVIKFQNWCFFDHTCFSQRVIQGRAAHSAFGMGQGEPLGSQMDRMTGWRLQASKPLTLFA